MLAAGANERGLKYLITVKYVDFILFIKKKKVGEKSTYAGQECWWELPPPPSPPAVSHDQGTKVRMLQAARPLGTRVAGQAQDVSPGYCSGCGSAGRRLVLEGCEGSSASAGPPGAKRSPRRCPRSGRFSPCPWLSFPFELVETRSEPSANPASLEPAQTAASLCLQPHPELRTGSVIYVFMLF